MPLIYCGRCDYCRRGLQHLCVTMACTGLSADWGGIAELANLEEYQVFRIPDAVSDEQGALIEPCAVAAYGVSRGPVRPGDSVLIAGGGPIGAFAALCAAAAGAGSVYLTEPNESRRNRARRLDLGEVFDPSDTDVPAELRERTDGLGVDIAIECAGFGEAFSTCAEAVKRRGTVVQVGLHVQPLRGRPDALGAERPEDRRELVLRRQRLASRRGADRLRAPARRARRHRPAPDGRVPSRASSG